jgi:hypothetical protein
MKIYIKYLSYKNILLDIENYESIDSIINKYFTKINENNSYNLNLDYYFLDYNGTVLKKKFSLEKYNIKENSILILHQKQKGGSRISKFIENPFIGFIIFLIIIAPIGLLASGIIPMISSLFKTILEKSFESIGQYLVCVLGKKTLFSRCSFLIFLVQYLIYIFLIYVIITFPIIILCVALKRNTLSDNFSSMCSAINVGGVASIILIMIYFGLYLVFRGGNIGAKIFIEFFKKFYITNMLFVPLIKKLLVFYNNFKYTPVYFTPFIGRGILLYHEQLDKLSIFVEIFLSNMIKIGCTTNISSSMKFATKLVQKMSTSICSEIKKCIKKDEENNGDNTSENLSKKKLENNESKQKPKLEGEIDTFCTTSSIKCCNPENFISTGNLLLSLIENPITNNSIKLSGFYHQYLLVTEAFYDSALQNLCSTKDTDNNNSKSNILNQIIEIKSKIKEINTFGKDYSTTEKSSFHTGESLFKTLFKLLFIDIFCNVSSTSNSAENLITKIGGLNQLTDMLKAGSSAGIFTTILYILTVIILCLCSLFGVF